MYDDSLFFALSPAFICRLFVCVSHSVVSNSETLWTCSPPGPSVHGISRQEDWSGLPFCSPRGLPNPGINPWSPALQADSLLSEPPGKTLFFFFFLVLPLYCYQPISLHPRAHMLHHVIPWTSARQAPLSMDFSRQEYWSGLPFPSPQGRLFNDSQFWPVWGGISL